MLANCPTCSNPPNSRPWARINKRPFGRCPVCADDQVTLLEIAVQLGLRDVARPPSTSNAESWRQQVQLVLQHYPDRRERVAFELWQRTQEDDSNE